MANEDILQFSSGATSSRVPRYDLIPREALVRLANRFELGLEKHKHNTWNALSSQKYCEDNEFIIARAAHVIDHALKFIATFTHQISNDGNDDAAAIAWGGIFLCQATQHKHDVSEPSEPTNWECYICNKRFTNKEMLEQHLRDQGVGDSNPQVSRVGSDSRLYVFDAASLPYRKTESEVSSMSGVVREIDELIRRRNGIQLRAENLNDDTAQRCWIKLGVANRHIDRVITRSLDLAPGVVSEINNCLDSVDHWLKSYEQAAESTKQPG